MIRLALLAVILVGCGAPRVAPVGTVTPNPQKPGTYTMNADLPQPEAADYRPGAGGGWLDLIGGLLPAPWGTVVGMLGSVLVAAPLARRGPTRALQQTVNGIEAAANDLPEEHRASLLLHLDKKQDEAAKRMVWDMRP